MPKTATSILRTTLTIALLSTATAALGAPERLMHVSVGDTSRPPIGWVEFCVEYKPECATKPSAPRDVVLSPKAWTDLVRVNNWANERIKPLTDQELEQKYRELAEPVIGKAKTEALLKDLWTLEKRKDCQLDYSATVVNMKRA